MQTRRMAMMIRSNAFSVSSQPGVVRREMVNRLGPSHCYFRRRGRDRRCFGCRRQASHQVSHLGNLESLQGHEPEQMLLEG